MSTHAPTLAAAPPPPDDLEVIYANEPPPEITRLDPDNWNPFDPQEQAQEPDLPEDRSDVEEEPPDDDTTVNLREAIEGAAAIEALDRIRVIRSPGDQSDDDDLGPSGIYVDPDAGCASDPDDPLRQEWDNGLAAHPFFTFHHMITSTRHWADVPRDVDRFPCNRS